MGFWIFVCLWLASLIFYKLFPVPLVTFLWIGIVGLILPLSGLIWGVTKKFAPRDIARWLDQEKGLKERLSTAVELSEAKTINPDWEALVIRDAACAVEKIDPKSLLPLQLPALCIWILLLLIACFALGFVPERRSADAEDVLEDCRSSPRWPRPPEDVASKTSVTTTTTTKTTTTTTTTTSTSCLSPASR